MGTGRTGLACGKGNWQKGQRLGDNGVTPLKDPEGLVILWVFTV